MVFLAAAVTILLGLIIVTHWPADSVWVLGTLLGVDLLFNGAGWVSFGLGLRAPALNERARQRSARRPHRQLSQANLILFREQAMTKWVYSFGGEKAEGTGQMRDLLGGKGANLAEMANLGLPVPPGFTITTEVCSHFYAHSRQYPDELEAQVEAALATVGDADRAASSARPPIRCWSPCVRAPGPRCPA